MSKMPNLRRNILKTLIYFDLQNQPLTLIELCRFLLRDDQDVKPTVDDLNGELQAMLASDQVETENGLYFLPGRGQLAKRRLAVYPIYLERVQKASRLVKILRFIPFVRGIAVSGSLAGMYSSDGSDIDFLVMVKPGRIWLARLFMSVVTQMLGVRRHGKLVANRVCLNHYITSGLVLEADHNYYSAVEYASLLCLFGPEAFDDFLRKQSWLKDFLVFTPAATSVSVYTVLPIRIIQKMLETVVDFLGGRYGEELARLMQKRRIKTEETVFVSDTELSFHPGSKGRQFLAKFEEKMGVFLS